jgi:DNA-binding MarR family transcriptional regulator
MPPTKVVPPEELLRLAERLRRAVGNFVRAVRGRSNTPKTARSDTLALLDREGAMSTAKLAQHRNVKHQSMRLVIEQLEREGLIEKAIDVSDRRSQLVTLTPQGRTALVDDRQLRTVWMARALQEQVTAQECRILEDAIVILERISATSSGI